MTTTTDPALRTWSRERAQLGKNLCCFVMFTVPDRGYESTEWIPDPWRAPDAANDYSNAFGARDVGVSKIRPTRPGQRTAHSLDGGEEPGKFLTHFVRHLPVLCCIG